MCAPLARLLCVACACAAPWLAPAVAQQAAQPEEDDLFDDGLDELLGGAAAPLDTGPASSPSALRAWRGYFELASRTYLRDRGGPAKDEQLLLEAELELEFAWGDELTGYLRPRVLLDLFDSDLKRFEPYEAYLTRKLPSADLRVGQFIENWGIADAYNPIDIINRRDYATDFLDPDRLGEIGARYRHFIDGNRTLGEPTVSIYALPVFQATRFPTARNRFSFSNGPLPFDEERGIEPDGFDRGLYAARFQSTLNSAPFNADLQLLVAHGPDRFPTLGPGTDSSGDPIRVPVYFGANTFGAGLRAVPNENFAGSFLSTLTLKAELALRSNYAFDDSPVPTPEDSFAYVLGVDRSFNGVFATQDQLTTMIEYAGESGADDFASTLRPFRNDVILRGLWEPNDFARSSLELRGFLDLDTQEAIFEAIFERQLRSLHEDIQLRVQLQLFDPAGDGSSLFDAFPNNSALVVGLRWDS